MNIKKYSYFVWGLIIFSVMATSSCIPQKEIKILQPTEGQKYNMTVFNPIDQAEYTLGKGDNLYIDITIKDPKQDATSSFSQKANNSSYFSDIGIYLNSYTVDVNGNILLPVVGNIKVEGLTTAEIKSLLETRLSKFVIDPTVVVRLVNFNVTILGEVQRPGEYKIYQNRINLLEAFAFAGDINTYGNRKQVKLLRQNGKKIDMHILNLTDESIIESPYYYLRPNDVLYVEPLKGKQFAFESFPYGLLFSTISTVIMLITFFKYK